MKQPWEIEVKEGEEYGEIIVNVSMKDDEDFLKNFDAATDVSELQQQIMQLVEKRIKNTN